MYRGYQHGFLVGVLSLVSTLLSLYFAILLFAPIAHFISIQFSINEKVTPILTFLGLILLFETIGNAFIALIDQYIILSIYRIRPLAQLDKILGIVPAFLTTALLITLVMLLPVTLPVSEQLRSDTEQSWWGKNVLPVAYANLPKIEKLANNLPTESLLYLIPTSPESEENIPLHLPQQLSLSIDANSEQQMLTLLNQERTSRGLKPLVLSPALTQVARAQSKDMFERHYFSHVNPDGKSPFDRMEAAGISFTVAGENLAYAPDVTIAHKGLMNSPGHRENILRPEFGHVGIGVIDGGIYGKMFTQDFTN